MRRISREKRRGPLRRQLTNEKWRKKEKRTRKSDEEKRALSRGKPTRAALTPDSHGLYQHSDKLYPVLCFSFYVANIVVLPCKKTAIDQSDQGMKGWGGREMEKTGNSRQEATQHVARYLPSCCFNEFSNGYAIDIESIGIYIIYVMASSNRSFWRYVQISSVLKSSKMYMSFRKLVSAFRLVFIRQNCRINMILQLDTIVKIIVSLLS